MLQLLGRVLVFFSITGIFLIVCDFSSTQNFISYRDNVKPLIEYVSRAQYTSYSTHAEAMAAYKHSKDLGLVHTVRTPGNMALCFMPFSNLHCSYKLVSDSK